MRTVARHRRRPNPIAKAEETRIEAVGLGLAAMGFGFALSEIYDARGFIYAGVGIGALLTVTHWRGPLP